MTDGPGRGGPFRDARFVLAWAVRWELRTTQSRLRGGANACSDSAIQNTQLPLVGASPWNRTACAGFTMWRGFDGSMKAAQAARSTR